jgi:altronate hydrolase
MQTSAPFAVRAGGSAFMPAVPLTQVAVHLRPNDNIAVAAKPLPAGTEVSFNGGALKLPSHVKMGHKFAVQSIKEGDAITKYGQIIGFAGRDIPPGDHVHVHNVKLGTFERDYAYCRETPKPPPPPAEYLTFLGYDRGSDRPDHLRYGTRNYLAIISTVNCSASTSKYVAERIRALDALKNFPNVDGVVPIIHKQGCAMAYDGDDHKQLDRTLAGFARHPNVAAYILIGLGCETGQAIHLIENEHLDLIQLNGFKKKPVLLTIQ